jgi:hypothetical protein
MLLFVNSYHAKNFQDIKIYMRAKEKRKSFAKKLEDRRFL